LPMQRHPADCLFRGSPALLIMKTVAGRSQIRKNGYSAKLNQLSEASGPVWTTVANQRSACAPAATTANQPSHSEKAR
jgi:hypothetical protein